MPQANLLRVTLAAAKGAERWSRFLPEPKQAYRCYFAATSSSFFTGSAAPC
jgi:hypothetical protein